MLLKAFSKSFFEIVSPLTRAIASGSWAGAGWAAPGAAGGAGVGAADGPCAAAGNALTEPASPAMRASVSTRFTESLHFFATKIAVRDSHQSTADRRTGQTSGRS